MKHEAVEKNIGLLAFFMVIAVSVGGLTQIVPLFFQDVTNKPVEGMKPRTALEVEGRDIYIREGCVGCHSQMIRPFRAETERYGHYSVAGESVWDHPFLWGSKRTGPGLVGVNTSVVLAGDPKQLGPVVRPENLKWFGFDLSMMKRIMYTDDYSNSDE